MWGLCMCLLALATYVRAQGSGGNTLATVLVTFSSDLPVSVGIGNSSGPTPQIVPDDVPGVTLVADLP